MPRTHSSCSTHPCAPATSGSPAAVCRSTASSRSAEYASSGRVTARPRARSVPGPAASTAAPPGSNGTPPAGPPATTSVTAAIPRSSTTAGWCTSGPVSTCARSMLTRSTGVAVDAFGVGGIAPGETLPLKRTPIARSSWSPGRGPRRQPPPLGDRAGEPGTDRPVPAVASAEKTARHGREPQKPQARVPRQDPGTGSVARVPRCRKTT
jgi:hypothetical protein